MNEYKEIFRLKEMLEKAKIPSDRSALSQTRSINKKSCQNEDMSV